MTSSSGSRTSTTIRRSCRRRRRRCARRASPAAWSRWTRPRCAGNSTCRISCSRTSWPATPRWAADRRCARPARSASAPMRPAHYLKQFLPKYSSVEAVNARAKQEGFENWVQMLHFKKDWELNTELPVLGPWRSVRPINNPIWLLERNPYYYAVDTAGNQLPYFDRDPVHACREPRGHQPARDGRRVRRAGAAHRPGQAAGAAR